MSEEQPKRVARRLQILLDGKTYFDKVVSDYHIQINGLSTGPESVELSATAAVADTEPNGIKFQGYEYDHRGTVTAIRWLHPDGQTRTVSIPEAQS